MRLGFACAWDSPPQLTWSYTPWSLRAELRKQTPIVDLGVTYPPAVRLALRAVYARRWDGHWTSKWRYSDLAHRYAEVAIRRSLSSRSVDAVLQIQDLASVSTPYLLYQDLSYDVLLERGDTKLTHFPTLSMTNLLRLRDRQREIYARAAGVLAMSQWFADQLIASGAVAADRVHVVHPGATALAAPNPAAAAAAHARRMAGPRRRLLFVGKDFDSKGGDLVVRALAVLRKDFAPDVSLTVVGPHVWPLPGEIPPGVDFRGRLPVVELARVYDEHDLFVMPSRFEGFGIAFVEALAHGLPVVGRRAFAMPEIITPGIDGDLVTGDDPADLATRVVQLLQDDAGYERVHARVASVAAHYSWRRAAGDVLTAVALATA